MDKKKVFNIIDGGALTAGFIQGLANSYDIDTGILGYFVIATPAIVRASASGVLTDTNLTKFRLKAENPTSDEIMTPEFLNEVVSEIHLDNPQIKTRDTAIEIGISSLSGVYAGGLAVFGYQTGFYFGKFLQWL